MNSGAYKDINWSIRISISDEKQRKTSRKKEELLHEQVGRIDIVYLTMDFKTSKVRDEDAFNIFFLLQALKHLKCYMTDVLNHPASCVWRDSLSLTG